LCKKKRKKKSLMCTGGMEEWCWHLQRDGEKWGTGETNVGGKVGGKVCAFNRFAAPIP
jgi:hypothetical protein